MQLSAKLQSFCEDFNIAAYKMAVKNLLSEIHYLENVTLASLADSHRNNKNANRRTDEETNNATRLSHESA